MIDHKPATGSAGPASWRADHAATYRRPFSFVAPVFEQTLRLRVRSSCLAPSSSRSCSTSGVVVALAVNELSLRRSIATAKPTAVAETDSRTQGGTRRRCAWMDGFARSAECRQHAPLRPGLRVHQPALANEQGDQTPHRCGRVSPPRCPLRLAGPVPVDAHDDGQTRERRDLAESSMAMLAASPPRPADEVSDRKLVPAMPTKQSLTRTTTNTIRGASHPGRSPAPSSLAMPAATRRRPRRTPGASNGLTGPIGSRRSLSSLHPVARIPFETQGNTSLPPRRA